MCLSNPAAWLLILCAWPGYSLAMNTTVIPWEELGAQEQRILGHAQSNWNEYSAERQQTLLRGTRKWLSMSRAERQQVRRHRQELKNMSPVRRQRVLDGLRRYKSLPMAERERLRETFQRYKRLPADRRQEIRRQWQDRTPAERRELRRTLKRKDRDRRGDTATQRRRDLGSNAPGEGARRRAKPRDRANENNGEYRRRVNGLGGKAVKRGTRQPSGRAARGDRGLGTR